MPHKRKNKITRKGMRIAEAMSSKTLSQFDLKRNFGLTQSEALQIYDLAPSMFGPGGRGLVVYATKISKIVKE